MKKIRSSMVFKITMLSMSAALMFVLSGCGNNIDSDAVNSNKVTGHYEESENSESDLDDENSSDGRDESTANEDESTSETGGGTTTSQDVNSQGTTTTESQPVSQQVQETTQPTTTQPATTQQPVTQPTTTAQQKPAYTVKINSPSAAGTAVSAANGYMIDYSNASNGYVMIKGDNAASGKIYIEIYKDAISSDNRMAQCVYSSAGQYATFALTKGSGKYVVRIVEIISGNTGTVKCTAEINAALVSETAPFVYPTFNVNFSAASTAVNKAYEICAGLGSDREKVQAVYNYVLNTLTYNYGLAGQVSSGTLTSYIPNGDNAIATGKGICCDYACLFATMLRCQGIPVKMIYGYVPNGYHAWNEVYYDGSWHLYDTTYEDDGGSKASSYTPNRIY